MSTKPSDPFTPFIGPGADAFKLWISFFPTAPLFGVEWRFAGMMPGMQGMPGMGQPGADRPGMSAGAKTKAKAKAEPARRAAPSQPAPVPQPPKAAAPVPQPPKAAAPVSAPSPEPKADTPAPAGPAAATPTPEAAPERPAASDLPARPANLFDETPAEPDDLKLIRGIGPGLESKLNALGIYKFDQIAGFSEADLVWIDENLTAFKGRCFRDDWVGQARELRG